MSRCGALGLKAIVMPLVLCFAGRMRPRPMCVEDIEPARDSAASPAEQTGSRFRARSLSSLREPESEVDTTVGNLMDSDAAKPHPRIDDRLRCGSRRLLPGGVAGRRSVHDRCRATVAKRPCEKRRRQPVLLDFKSLGAVVQRAARRSVSYVRRITVENAWSEIIQVRRGQCGQSGIAE